MLIEKIPDAFINNNSQKMDLFVYDFKMTEEAIKTKVNLNMHMFSFLQTGIKQVHFVNDAVLVNNKQSILIKKGNYLWTELLDKSQVYYCKLFFFSDEKLREFLNKHFKQNENVEAEATEYFKIENDNYLNDYLNSLTTIMASAPTLNKELIAAKFDELLLYLIGKYGISFQNYLLSLINNETSNFEKKIENIVYSTLTIDEIAFLCNMSLSTFKRQFIKVYKASPGKWLREKRLLKAKEMLKEQKLRPSDIYFELGYNNLANFSIAFKNRFGISPSEVA